MGNSNTSVDFASVPALPALSEVPTHAELRALADAAYAQFIALGGKVTVCPPGPKN